MNLFIISGASGMTGSELCNRIIEGGGHVIGFDNFFASDYSSLEHLTGHPEFEFYEMDLTNREQMNWLSREIRVKRNAFQKLIYINCAAVVHTEHFYHVNSTFQTNVVGMKNFLDDAILMGADIFINCSTSEVYSMQSYREGGVREDDYLLMATAEHSQRTSYATGKLLTEFFMKDAASQKKSNGEPLILGCSIRFANVYADKEKYPKHIIPHIINSLRKDGKVVLLENAKQTRRTFLHNIDSCNGVLELINSPEALDGSVYNIATEEEVSILELVKKIADAMGVIPKIEFSGVRASDPPRRYLSTEKIRSRTHWKPTVTLEEGIQRCLRVFDK